MIHIIKDYYIDVDENNYTVKRDTGKTTIIKKTQEEVKVYDIIGYYGSLNGAIKGCLDRERRNILSKGERTLNEAILCLKTLNKEFIDVLEKCIKQMESN